MSSRIPLTRLLRSKSAAAAFLLAVGVAAVNEFLDPGPSSGEANGVTTSAYSDAAEEVRDTSSSSAPDPTPSDAVLAAAFRERRNDLQVRGQGRVVKVLPDDTKGSQHQRFLLQLDSGQTLLVAHNIDLAPRIPDLRSGDRVAFFGEYEWNERGGVIHWTHHDPGGRHVDGWLEHEGRRYE